MPVRASPPMTGSSLSASPAWRSRRATYSLICGSTRMPYAWSMRLRISSPSTAASFAPSSSTLVRRRDVDYRPLTLQIIQEVTVGCSRKLGDALGLPLVAEAVADQDVAGAVFLGDGGVMLRPAFLVTAADFFERPLERRRQVADVVEQEDVAHALAPRRQL